MHVRFTALSVLLMAVSFNAAAHSIDLTCEQEGSVQCLTIFSDGSSADNIPYQVISYEDELLLSGKTDPDSRFSFDTPDAEYYILLDAGPGHVVELDMEEIN